MEYYPRYLSNKTKTELLFFEDLGLHKEPEDAKNAKQNDLKKREPRKKRKGSKIADK